MHFRISMWLHGCVHYVKEGSICEHEVEDYYLSGLLQGQCVVG